MTLAARNEEMRTFRHLAQFVTRLKHLKEIRRLDAVWVRFGFGMFEGRRGCRRARANLLSCSVEEV